MNTPSTQYWLIGGAVLAALYLASQTNPVQSGVEDVQAALSGWQSVNSGPQWVPVLHVAENTYGIPPDLLARMAYQESRFRDDIITGATLSPAGDLGILQLSPHYFSSVQVPRPFSAQDTGAQITQAAAEVARLYAVYGDWSLVIAAYDWGEGNVDRYRAAGGSLPTETANYVAQVLGDVPVPGPTVLMA